MADERRDSQGEAKQSFFAKQQLINSAKATFQHLAAVIKNATLYPESHPTLLSSAEKLVDKITELLVDRKEVAFYLVGGELFFETHSVPVDQSHALLMEQFVSKEIGGIIFKPGLTQMEVIQFARLMNKEPALFVSAEGVNAELEKENISHIELHRAIIIDKKTSSAIKDSKKASTNYKGAIDTVKDMVHAVHIDKNVNMRKMNTTVQSMVDDILDNRDAFIGLTSIKMYDEYTFAHSVNTAILAISLGTFLALNKNQVAMLGIAGLLHDIGKVSLPLEIVNKPGKLTDEEWKVIQRHPVEGALVLSDVPGVTKMAMVTSFEHHQHGDHHGYPQIDGGPKQHLFSKIVALVDAYEAITADRVYYNSRTPPDKAIGILLKNSRGVFDPMLVKAFVNMIGFFPIGTLVKLDTGEVGLVVHQTRDLMRPRVLLLTKFDGSEKETGTEVSLLETASGKFVRSIVGTIDPNVASINIKLYLD
jgi:HD-GYP domain-containing protein (c-di-GMP phosphodiesterase class II)